MRFTYLSCIFDSFTCHHIYRERNTTADYLSKEVAIRDDNSWMICEDMDGVMYLHYHRPFIDPEALCEQHRNENFLISVF